MVRIAPSLLAADFACLGDEIRKVEAAGAEVIHVDVMDGHFVPNLTMGPFIVEAVRRVTDLFIDVHLMIDEPQRYAEAFIKAGADNITIHHEAVGDDGLDILASIRSFGARCGISIKPATSVAELEAYKGLIDLVLIMSVEPGFGGQSFMTDALDKIAAARELFGSDVDIEVDGGIKPDNAAAVVKAGADILVAGTAVFRADDPAEAIRTMKG